MSGDRSQPDAAEEQFSLGQTLKTGLLDTKRILRAKAAFAQAVELRDDFPQAWYELALTSAWLSDLDSALAALRRAIELDPTIAQAWRLLYMCLAEQGLYEEAVDALQRASDLDPESREIAYELERIRRYPARKGDFAARFPLKTAAFDDFETALDRFITPAAGTMPPFISETSAILTLGSCFARNIAIALRAAGVNAQHAEQGEDINTTYANRFFIAWLLGEPTPHSEVFDRVFGESYRARMEDVLRRADGIVYSLGVAPCFFDRATGEPVMTVGVNQHFSLRAANLEFRTTSVAENVENLSAIARMITGANPRATFVLTVSPVPLRASPEYTSAVVADCVSKSTLRVAADEFLRREEIRGLYWASFEAVRWIGGYTQPVYGSEDGSAFHVNQHVVDAIARAFIKRFGTAELASKVD